MLDHLGIDKAHIVGASMGGMIAQTVAIRYPHRTLSLVSIMSNTGGRWHGQPALSMYAVLLKPSPSDRDGFIERGIEMFTKIGGSGFEPDIEDLRDIATRSYDRGHDPHGSQRQLAAIIADRDRTPLLRRADDPRDRHPRRRGQARAPLRRAHHGERDPRREAADDRRHGPRPAARRLAADHRRDRRDRAGGRSRRGGAHTSTRMSTITISTSTTKPLIALPFH